MNKKVILWFRQDLRVHDNEALRDALLSGSEILPLYIFDERIFNGTTTFGFKKTGIFRAKFIIESVKNLRKNLEKIGLGLVVRIGKPEVVIYNFAKELKTSWIFCNRERTKEEKDVQDNLEKNLWSVGQEIRYSRGKMLYYTSDLPFPVTHTPDFFSTFKKEVEKFVDVRTLIPIPTKNLRAFIDKVTIGEIPKLPDFGFSDAEIEQTKNLTILGGEDEALDRLKYYIWDAKHEKNYKDNRNGVLGDDFSSKLSSWLSQGCISPKKVFHEIKKYKNKKGIHEFNYQLFLALMWRDFFRLMGKKHGNKIFLKGGTKQEPRSDLSDKFKLFKIWADGRTGFPLVDANMLELKNTGFISSRGRQNVASFLVNDLKINWIIGAEYFESLLIDYDPCSNYGNWNYIAGVGSDPRENRYYNVIFQSRKYDPEGIYLSHWLPSLKCLCPDKIHEPFSLSREKQAELGFILGKDYPKACVKIKSMI
ncbi:MAG: DASH family cryptochrome [Saprospiraceae bacterium]